MRIADHRSGDLRLQVTTAAPGQLVVRAAGSSLTKESATRQVTAAGRATVTLTPTAVGLTRLKHAHRPANSAGTIGEVEVAATVTSTSHSGFTHSLTRRYTR